MKIVRPKKIKARIISHVDHKLFDMIDLAAAVPQLQF